MPQDHPANPRRYFLYAIGLVIVLVVCTLRVQNWLHDPNVFFLASDPNAKCIRHDVPFNVQAEHNLNLIRTTFQYEFDLPQTVTKPRLVVQAFRSYEVWVDSDSIDSAPFYHGPAELERWKEQQEISLPEIMTAGKHVLRIRVANRKAQPCLLAYSRELGISTAGDWSSSLSNKRWKPVALVDNGETDFVRAMEEIQRYPTTAQSFRSQWPMVAALFITGFLISLIVPTRFPNVQSQRGGLVTPGGLRYLLMIAWIIMALNNIPRVRPDWGYDLEGHLEYLRFIMAHRRLPLATEGWQTFQSPLAYIIATPVYAMFLNKVHPELAVRAIRIFPLLAGLAQIEWIYRAAKRVLPGRTELQSVAILFGSLMPMNLYTSQAFSNEPIGSCFTSLTVVCCFFILSRSSAENGRTAFALLGIAWGLALLSKVTCVLLAPLIVVVVGREVWTKRASSREAALRFGVTLLTAFLIAGWYYIRNWVLLGTPFIGGWDPRIAIQWWQDPSYRSLSQFLSFGYSLNQPVYSGVTSFWDALYSTMYADGFLMGFNCAAKDSPWNSEWMAVASFLSLFPMGCMAMGMIRTVAGNHPELPVFRFSIAAIGIYLAALIDLYIHVPVFSQAKASYLLGLLPCFAILSVAGAEPLLQFRWVRPVFWGWLATWSISSYFAFFCLR